MTANTTRLILDENDPLKRNAAFNQLAEKMDGALNTISGLFADPTGSVGLTTVNGTAATAMRSDAAPALSQAITPVWTGLHAFTVGLVGGTSANSILSLKSTSSGSPSGDKITLSAGGSVRATILSGGNIGFGTETNPAQSFVFSKNVTTGIPPPSGAGTHTIDIIDADGTATNIGLISFGTSVRSLVQFASARGTAAAFTATQSGDEIGVFGAVGASANNTWGGGGANLARIVFKALETYTSTTLGTGFLFETTPNGSTSRAEAVRIQSSGGISIGTTTDGGIGSVLANTSVKSQSATAGIGYATGAGGTVTQSAPKTTGVTLNKISGQITTDSSGIVAGASQGFTFTNSTIAATDVVVVSMASGGSLNSYNIVVDAVAAGSCHISMHNKTAGNLSEALVLNFAVIKAVTS